MKWSWTIGRIAGIQLRVHATFLILLAWMAMVAYRATGSVSGTVTSLVLVLALFVSVLLHELGHALAGRRVGVPTRDITLLPIGGVARLAFIPDKPKQELRIALAGPAVTLAIVIVLFIGLSFFNPAVIRVQNSMTYGTIGAFIAELMWLNGMLLVFNLLPAFPMDGGRVLRALLALRLDYVRATDIATRIGRGFALIFALFGLFYNPMLVLVALFIWISAAAESAELQQRVLLSGVPVNRVMIRDIRTLEPTATLHAALSHVLAGFQQDFPVVADEQLVGVLTRADLLAALAKSGEKSLVGEAMETSFRTADPDEPLADAVARLRECRCRTLPVVAAGKLRGVLTLDNIAEYVMIEAALKAPAQRPPLPGLGDLAPSFRGRA